MNWYAETGTPFRLVELTFNTTDGWIGYPDFTQRYATLWHTGE